MKELINVTGEKQSIFICFFQTDPKVTRHKFLVMLRNIREIKLHPINDHFNDLWLIWMKA